MSLIFIFWASNTADTEYIPDGYEGKRGRARKKGLTSK